MKFYLYDNSIEIRDSFMVINVYQLPFIEVISYRISCYLSDSLIGFRLSVQGDKAPLHL